MKILALAYGESSRPFRSETSSCMVLLLRHTTSTGNHTLQEHLEAVRIMIRDIDGIVA